MNEELYQLLGLDPEKIRQQQMTQGLLSAGLQLLAGSGYSPTRRTTGELLGQAGAAGLGAYQQAGQASIDEALRAMQLRQMMEQQKRQQAFRDATRAAMVRQPTVSDVMAQQSNIEPERLEGMSIQEVAAEAPKSAVGIDRDRLLSAIAEFAPEKYLELTQPKPADLPASVREYQFAQGQGYKGTFQDFVTEQKRAGASSVNVTMPGNKKIAEVLGAKTGERLDNSLNQAQEAQSTLQNIGELRPILQQGVFSGPLSGAPRAVAQIATSLGVTGKDTKELLDRTAVAMQGLAKFELSAASAMRGQGAITENERMLIQRAAAGRLDQFTAGEVQALLTAMEKTANYRIASHNRQLDVLRRSDSPEVRDMAQFYELSPLSAPVAPSGGRVKKFNPATGRVE